MATLKIGVSACLLGHSVRYNGSAKLQDTIVAELQGVVELISFCPEVEAGLGIPREPIQLVKSASGIRVLQVDDDAIDRTELLRDCTHQQSWFENIHGYIVKARSPSCGYASTPLWSADKETREIIGMADGEFVRLLKERCPNLPLIDEEQWQDSTRRKEFLAKAKRYVVSKGEESRSAGGV